MSDHKIIKLGFIEPEIKEEDYILGAGNIPEEILQPDRQWTDFLPVDERQHKGVETYNCTSFHTNNPYEILIRRKFSREENFSDRCLGILAGTYPPGNDPNKVAQALRENGVCLETHLPFSDDIKNVDDYYSPKPLTASLKAECEKFLDKYETRHEWVFKDKKTPLKEKQEKMWEALQYSPLGASVVAWKKDGKYFVKNIGEQDTHWTTVIGGKKGEYWLVMDSYEPFSKKLAWDYDFGYVKRYWIREREVGERQKRDLQLGVAIKLFLLGQVAYAWKVIKAIIGLDKEPTSDEIVEEVKEEIKEPTNKEKLVEIAKQSLGKDISPRNLAPQELSCAEGVSELIKKIHPDFPILVSTKELADQLKKDTRFEATLTPSVGCIVISPRTQTKNGHTGIFTKEDTIASNSSKNGKFEENYTWNSWIKAFRDKKGLRIYLYEPR